MPSYMFTRRHYVMVAAAMRRAKPAIGPQYDAVLMYQWENDVEELIGLFAGDNDKFDVVKFKEACGYPGAVR